MVRKAIAVALSATLLGAGAFGIGCITPVNSPCTIVETAQAAEYVTLCKSYVLISAPKSWKKSLDVCAQGHTSGAYHIDFYLKSSTDYRGPMIMRIDGMTDFKAAKGSTTCKYQGVSEYDTLEWRLTCGKKTAGFSANNMPYRIWCSVHKKGEYADWEYTNTEMKQALAATTGGKITLSDLKKWSESKAKKQGVAIEKAYLTKAVVKRMKIV